MLGATGSIGLQTLEVATELGIPVAGLATRSGSEALHALAVTHPEARVAVAAPTPSERRRLEEMGARIGFGDTAVEALAGIPGTIVVNGIVGAAGLRASLAALGAGNRLALANKETMVAGGPVVAAAAGSGEIIPVDSEHSAVHQLIAGRDAATMRRVVLTASGGPFRELAPDLLAAVTPEQALHHPTWSMGPRITIDSATLMNKALEVIEAHFLFGIPYDRIGVVVHPQSIVHAMVELEDGALLAHLGPPDMRIPIRYAITHPDRASVPSAFSLAGRDLTFEEPDVDRFPCLALGYEAGRAGGSAPAVLNAADEIAVHAFLTGRIGFTSIPVVVERTLADVRHRPLATVEDVIAVDREARAVASGHLGASC